MVPNRYSSFPNAEWLAEHGYRLVRRAEETIAEPTAAARFAHNSGKKIQEWINHSSSTSVFVATIIISLGLLLCTCAFIWEVLRCCRRRASNKGWRALQDERPAAPVGMSLYEPRNSSGLYDDPSAGQRQGGVQMRAGGTAPPPLPPMPRGYQMSFRPPPPQAQPHPQPQRTHSHPAPLLPAPQQPPAPLRTASVPTGSAHRLQLQDVVLTSPVDPMKESHQMSQIIAEASAPYPGSDILIDSGRTSDSNATEPLILPAPPSAPLIPASAPQSAPAIPTTTASSTNTTSLVQPVTRESSMTASIVSEKAPTVELKRSWTPKNWGLGGDEKKDNEEAKK